MTSDSLSEFVRNLCRFQYEDVSDEERQQILSEIEQHGVEPFHSGSSLHAWDACYEVASKYYRLIGAHGRDFKVERIIDTYPEAGPIKDTYK